MVPFLSTDFSFWSLYNTAIDVYKNNFAHIKLRSQNIILKFSKIC